MGGRGVPGTELEENTHLPVLAGAVDTDFIKKQIGRGGGRVPNSRKTISPVIAGAIDPEFTKKTIKGGGSELGGTHLPVLAIAVDADFIKNQ